MTFFSPKLGSIEEWRRGMQRCWGWCGDRTHPLYGVCMDDPDRQEMFRFRDVMIPKRFFNVLGNNTY